MVGGREQQTIGRNSWGLIRDDWRRAASLVLALQIWPVASRSRKVSPSRGSSRASVEDFLIDPMGLFIESRLYRISQSDRHSYRSGVGNRATVSCDSDRVGSRGRQK